MNHNTYITMKERTGFIALLMFILTCHSLSSLSYLFTKGELVQIEIENKSPVATKPLEKKTMIHSDNGYPQENPDSRKNSQSEHQKPKAYHELIKEEKFESFSIKNKTNQAIILIEADTIDEVHSLSAFDPNSASQQELKNHNLPKFAINNLMKYRQAGGVLKRDSDLLKIYGIDSITFSNVQPYLRFPKKEPPSNTYNFDSLDINTASADQLMKLSGIGPVLSRRIVEYRSRLGGYYRVSQLTEVYGLKEETFHNIEPFIFTSKKVATFYPPSLTFKEILKHPYMDYETTKLVKNISLLNYTDELSSILESGELDERVLPYLSIHDKEDFLIDTEN